MIRLQLEHSSMVLQVGYRPWHRRKRATSDEGKHAFHRTTRHRRIGSAAVPGSGLLGGASEGESTLSLQQPSAEESGTYSKLIIPMP